MPDHELIRCIGSGAYGEVWLARNVFGTHRAVKLVYRDTFKDDRPFEREFRGIQKFEPISRSNDGLVDVLQIGRDDDLGLFYYVMELADPAGSRESEVRNRNRTPERAAGKTPGAGPCFPDPAGYVPRTLAGEIQRLGRLPFEECLPMAITMTLALAHLHRHGLIHRDLKPSNIIFVDGLPKLADIGLVTEMGEARSIVGTEGFIAPEGPNSPQSDIYSLGKVLYEMSMGKDRLDFPEPFTRLGQATSSAGLEELNAVILRACATDPRERYQSAEELHVDLALLQSGKSVKFRHVLERRLGLARRAAFAVAALAALSFAAFLFQRAQTREAMRLRLRAEDLTTRLQMQNAENLFARGESAMALAHLAQLMFQNPGNRIVAERLQSALEHRHFPALSVAPLMHESAVRHARYSPDGERIAAITSDRAVYYWHARTGERLIAPLRHQGQINAADFSADGQRLITGGSDNTAIVWSLRTGRPDFTLPHPAHVNAATFSPDDRWLATGCEDGGVRLYAAADGSLSSHWRHAGEVNALQFSPRDPWLAAAGENSCVKVWNATTGQPVHELAADGRVALIQFSHAGEHLAAAIQHWQTQLWEVRIWSVPQGQPLGQALLHRSRIYSLEFSPDDSLIVTGTANNAARVWETASGRERFRLPHAAGVYSATFAADGRQILTAALDHTARLWDAASGTPISEPMRHDGRVVCAAFSPAGDQILTASWDQTIKLWSHRPRVSNGRTLLHRHWVRAADFDPRGEQLLTMTAGGVFTASRINQWAYGRTNVLVLRRVRDGTVESRVVLPGGAEPLAAQFTSAGPRAFVLDRPNRGRGHIWNVIEGRSVPVQVHHDGEITSAQFSPAGDFLATGSTDGTARIWNSTTAKPLGDPLVHRSRVSVVRISPDGSILASGDETGRVLFWNTSGSTPRHAIVNSPGAGVTVIRFNTDGSRFVTGSRDSRARVWTTSGPTCVALLPHAAPIESAEFSPEGTRVVTASGDRTARIWDARTGRQLTPPLEHNQLVIMARFSPDGLRVITASFDETAQIWDAATGLKLSEPIRHASVVVDARFSPAGDFVVSASSDNTARLTPLPNRRPETWTDLARRAEAIAGLHLLEDQTPEAVPPLRR